MSEVNTDNDASADEGDDGALGFDERFIVVDPGQAELRIDKFIIDRTVRISRTRIQDGLRAGSITVNGARVKPNYKVRPRDEIRMLVPRYAEDQGTLKPQAMDLDIVHEDADLLVVNKPAGLVVHPGVGNWNGTLVNGLAHYLRHADLPVAAGNSDDRPGLVHRIDKDTSGLLVIAKTPWAMTHLARQFFDHTVDRKYWALVWGAPEPPDGTIEANVVRDTSDRRRMMVSREADLGKHAVTHYRTLEDFYYVSLIECQLETGRTHQIRVHMRHLGHPLFNDGRYGGDKIRKGTVFTRYRQFVENTFRVMPRQALHARTLGFTHPITGLRMEFEAELPDDFAGGLDRWRRYLDSRKEVMRGE